MKLKITFKNIPEWKQEYLQADFVMFYKEMKFQMLLMMDKLKNDKGFQAKFLNRIKKFKSLEANVVNMEMVMNGLGSIDLGSTSFEIDKENKKFVVYFEMTQLYFDMVNALKKSHSILGYGLVNKKQMIKDFSKAFRKNITHNFKIEELKE